jgi:arylsulfatase A-like enzyme
VDDLIGLIVRELERLGLSNNTVLVITADHGEAFMEHGYIEHTACLHNEVIRVPLILSGPKLPRARRIPSQVRSIDIMPTLLDLCGLVPKAEVEGISLLPQIANADNRDLVAASETERGGGQTAVTDGRYKMIRKNAEERAQLYEVIQDPDEQCDIANTHPSILSAMESQFSSWKQEVTSCADRYWRGQTPGPALEMEGDLIGRLRNLGYLE